MGERMMLEWKRMVSNFYVLRGGGGIKHEQQNVSTAKYDHHITAHILPSTCFTF